jgi:hypothetical protein
MKKFLPLIILFAACSSSPDKGGKVSTSTLVQRSLENKDISDSTNTLNGKIETLELEYIVWGCACANWVTHNDYKKYQNNNLVEHCIYIEPASKELAVPLYFDPGRHFIKVTGQFYSRSGYPKGPIQGEEHLNKAKVFHYTKIDVLKKDVKYSPKDDITLNLVYNAVACTCSQWSDIKTNSDTVKKYYYLEPANNKLVDADKLWKGDNLPLQIQVTGQIISYSGYPTGFNPTKGNPEAANVFRYTKIKVLKNGEKKTATNKKL